MDALRAWMGSDLDAIMVGTWMLCGHAWGLIWTLSWLAHGCSAGMDWVVSGRSHGHGWGLIWTLSWLAHGCSAGVDAAHPDGANVEGLNLFARAPSAPVAPAPAAPSPVSAVPQSQGTFFRPSSVDGCLAKDFFERPRWNRSTVPKPGSSEGIRVKHTRQTAWGAENEDRRSLEAQARDLRVKVTSAELARCLRADVPWDAVIAPGLGSRSRPSSRGATWGKVR
eukprot:s2630_g1.t1